MSKNHHRPRPLRRDMLGKGADKKGAALAGLVTAILLLAGCYTYVPMRPVTTPMPTSDSGLAGGGSAWGQFRCAKTAVGRKASLRGPPSSTVRIAVRIRGMRA
jgi:hypothetical protein